MSKEYRRDSINNELDKLQEQMKLLNKLGGLLEEQQSRNLSISKQMNIQNDILETRRKLEAQGLKNLQTQFAVDTKAIEIDKRISMLYDERLRLQESISREKEKQAKIDAENARKSRVERDAELKSDIERIKNHSRINDLEEKQLHRQKAIARAYKDKSDAEKQEIMNNDAKLKQLEKSIKLEQKARQREEKSKQTKDNAINSIRIPGLGSVGSLKEFSELKLSAQIFSVGAETFNKAVETFTGLFKDGMNRVYTNSNNQFTNIATRTGMSYGTYRSGIAGMGNNLKNWGGYDLQDNLKTSDVQNMMNSLATAGIGQENLMATAVENAITNTIVPYLDTSSAQFNLLNTRLDGNFVKQIRGINEATLEMSGSTIMNQQVLSSILDEMAPLSDKALQDLAKESTQLSALANVMVTKGGFTQEQAMSYITQLYKQQEYSDQIMRSGNTYEKSALYSQFLNDVNIYQDPAAGVMNNLKHGRDWSALFSGYGDTYSGYVSNIVGSAMGVDYNTRTSFDKMGNSEFWSELDRVMNMTEEELERYNKNAEKNFANGEYQTAAVKQETYMENISTELAMFKTDAGHWFDVLTTAVQGIAKILISSLLFKAGSSILNSLVGKGSGGLGIGSALTAFAGTGLGYQAMGVGASMGINSVPAATAAGLALPAGIAAGGLAVGGYGVSQGIKDIQGGDTARGVISTAGGVAAAAGGIGVAGGMLAAGAANAWNPVGWGLLIAGSLAVAGTAISRATDTTVDLADEFDAKKNASVRKIKAYNEEYIDDLYDVKEAIRQSTSVEEAKQIALENGIITQEELNDAAIQSKDALLEIANIKIEDQNELNKGVEDLVGIYSDIKQGKIEGIANSAAGLMNTAQAFQGNYKDLTDTQKQEMNQFMQSYIKWAEEYGNEDDKWRVKQYGDAFADGNFHENDYNKIFNGDNATTRARFEAFATSDEGAKILSRTDAFKNKYGKDGYYVLSDEDIMNYVNKAYAAGDIDTAKSYLGVLRDYDMPWDKLGSKLQTQFIEKYGEDIKSYRIGLDSVPFDNYPALLHEGEAVLTASTANELRSLVDEYRETKNDSARISQAIENQTAILVAKLDAIYSKMPDNADTLAESIMPGKLQQNMRNMTSTFNTL